MAQHDYVIANASGATVRADINNMALAISSNNSGSSEPSTKYAYLWWLDTSANVLKLRNSANNAWITMPFSVTANNTVDINGGTIDGTNIGASSAGTGAFTSITGSLASTITTTDNTDTLSLISTDTDAGVGPNLRLYRNSGSPADNDVTGVITFTGRNDNSQDVIYARHLSYISDASDGTEDGIFKTQTMVAGTIRDRLNITPSEISINEDSQDVDFRVESNGNANAIFVNGGDDRITFFNGTTVNAASGTDDGVSHYSDGRTDISRASGQALNLRRRTNDGVIINFYKEASGSVANVGSIGVGNSNDLTIGTADTGLVFQDNEIIAPFNPSTNALRDAAIDIGNSDRRFKDLYLSGGVHLGGIGSANKLDDYEEGTWTPTSDVGLTTTTACRYVKVGNHVTITFDVEFGTSTSGSQPRILSLPFSLTTYNGGYTNWQNTGSGVALHCAATSANLYNSVTNAAFTYAAVSGKRVIGTIVGIVA